MRNKVFFGFIVFFILIFNLSLVTSTSLNVVPIDYDKTNQRLIRVQGEINCDYDYCVLKFLDETNNPYYIESESTYEMVFEDNGTHEFSVNVKLNDDLNNVTIFLDDYTNNSEFNFEMIVDQIPPEIINKKLLDKYYKLSYPIKIKTNEESEIKVFEEDSIICQDSLNKNHSFECNLEERLNELKINICDELENCFNHSIDVDINTTIPSIEVDTIGYGDEEVYISPYKFTGNLSNADELKIYIANDDALLEHEINYEDFKKILEASYDESLDDEDLELTGEFVFETSLIESLDRLIFRDEDTQIKSNGQFSKIMALKQGMNHIYFVAKNEYNAIKIEERIIDYIPNNDTWIIDKQMITNQLLGLNFITNNNVLSDLTVVLQYNGEGIPKDVRATARLPKFKEFSNERIKLKKSNDKDISYYDSENNNLIFYKTFEFLPESFTAINWSRVSFEENNNFEIYELEMILELTIVYKIEGVNGDIDNVINIPFSYTLEKSKTRFPPEMLLELSSSFSNLSKGIDNVTTFIQDNMKYAVNTCFGLMGAELVGKIGEGINLWDEGSEFMKGISYAKNLICDRVFCPTVPPVCGEVEKNEDNVEDNEYTLDEENSVFYFETRKDANDRFGDAVKKQIGCTNIKDTTRYVVYVSKTTNNHGAYDETATLKCVSENQSSFEKNLMAGRATGCYNFEEDQTKCWLNLFSKNDPVWPNVNPSSDLITSTACGCIPGFYASLNLWSRFLNNTAECFEKVSAGEFDAGYCEDQLLFNLCDIGYGVFKTIFSGEVSASIGDALGFEDLNDIITNTTKVTSTFYEDMVSRYGGAIRFSLDGTQSTVSHAICNVAIYNDWSDLTGMASGDGSLAQSLLEGFAVTDPLVRIDRPKSRVQTQNPFSGSVIIDYNVNLYLDVGGHEDFKYSINFICDPRKENNEYCPNHRVVKEAVKNRAVSGLFQDVLSFNSKDLDAENIWFNQVEIIYSYGNNVKTKYLPITRQGDLPTFCRISATLSDVGFTCEGLGIEGMGTLRVSQDDFSLTPQIQEFYPSSLIVLKMDLEQINEPENVFVEYNVKNVNTGAIIADYDTPLGEFSHNEMTFLLPLYKVPDNFYSYTYTILSPKEDWTNLIDQDEKLNISLSDDNSVSPIKVELHRNSNGRLYFETDHELTDNKFFIPSGNDSENSFMAYSVESQSNNAIGEYSWEINFWRDVNKDGRIENDYDDLLKNSENFSQKLPTFSGNFRINLKPSTTSSAKPKFEIISPIDGAYLNNIIGIFWKPKENDNKEYSLEYAIDNQAYSENYSLNSRFFNISLDTEILNKEEDAKLSLRLKEEPTVKSTIKVIGSKSTSSNVRIIGETTLVNELRKSIPSSGTVQEDGVCESDNDNQGICKESCDDSENELGKGNCAEGLFCCQEKPNTGINPQ